MNITRIYLVTNCYGDPNKVYIGKTKNSSRENDHKRKYGKDIIYTYIDEVESLKKEDWEPLETFWIQYFKYLGFDIQNIRMKGGSGPEFYSEETCLKMSLQRKGKPIHNDISKKSVSDRFKGVKMSDDTKEKIRLKKTGQKYPNRSYKTEYHVSQETKEKISKALKGKPKPVEFKEIFTKSVLQYGLDGKFIKKWNNQLEAENFLMNKQLNKSSDYIGSCCRGLVKSSFGFLWKYEIDNYPLEIKPYNKIVKGKEININGVLYSNLRQAAKYLGITENKIYKMNKNREI